MDSESRAFDLAKALAVVEGDGDLLVATTRRFVDQNPRRLDRLREAIERRDLGEIERLARDLVEAAQGFAAADTERAARALMQGAVAGDAPALRTLFERAEAALSDLTHALAAHCMQQELRNVLIADDDDVGRKRLARLLEEWGHRVTPVSRGDVALEILGHEGAPHLALIDWRVPGMAGVDLCRALRTRRADTYIILITAPDDPDALRTGLEAGADDFLVLPLTPEELRARLRAGQRIVELQESLATARGEQRRHADRDGLTGATSRRRIFDLLEGALVQNAAQAKELTVVMIDLDDFKRVNDEHGPLVGDHALRMACERMKQKLRRTDLFGRCGGDEFLAVLPESSRRKAVGIGQRMCDALASGPIECGDVLLRITASFGVVTVDETVCQREEVLKRADDALFRAKAGGGNQVMAARPDPLEDACGEPHGADPDATDRGV